MPINPKALAELERRGVDNVRLILGNLELVGPGRQSQARLGLGDDSPLRGDVEDWLAAKGREAEGRADARHAELLHWTKIAGVAAVVGAVAAIAAVIVPLLVGLR